jgi:transcriptional regulator with XRE-family HTH domain
MPPSTTPDTTTPDTTTSFGARLKHERERRKISIESIAESTKILGALLEGLERDDVSRWPIGLYRRAFFRSYAQAIGVDPETTLREFLERFPEPEPLPLPVEPPREGTRVRLTLPQRISWYVGGRLIARLPARWNAVGFDAAVLGSVSLCLFVALGVFWAPFGVAAATYYCGGILLFGNSPGVCLFAPRPDGLVPWGMRLVDPKEIDAKPAEV